MSLDSYNSKLTARAASNAAPQTEMTNTSDLEAPTAQLTPSVEDLFEEEKESSKIASWRSNFFSVGLTNATWADESQDFRQSMTSSGGRKKIFKECCECCDDDQTEPDCSCSVVSSIICSKVGAGRVGNMIILSESTDAVTGERKLNWVVGPYWPMLLFVTYPLIIGISVFVARSTWGRQHPLVSAVWLLMSIGLCVSLLYTGCRDPGVLPRYKDQPDQSWRWNDQAQTFRPPGSIYDAECGCVVEEFDHVCPWTGTAIGKSNMPCFKIFVSSICGMIVIDILLCSGALAFAA